MKAGDLVLLKITKEHKGRTCIYVKDDDPDNRFREFVILLEVDSGELTSWPKQWVEVINEI